MVDVEAIPPIVRLQLGVFEALRKMGFPSEEIFVSWNHGNPLTVLQHNGKRFHIDYKGCPVPADQKSYEAAWIAGAESWNTEMTDDERDQIFNRWGASGASVDLITALLAAGFMPPRTADA